jgi:hypothetical protein
MGEGARRRQRQKEQRRYEHQVKPMVDAAIERWGRTATIEAWEGRIIDPVAVNDPAGQVGITKKWLHTRLENPGGKADVKKVLDTYSEPLPNGYYVIVGCGAAAMVNHTTLRQSKQGRDRLAGLPVMHIGLPDPWLTYREHGMGQPPYLLGLPGYHNPVPPGSPLFAHSCNSTVFADSTAQELAALQNNFEAYCVTGFVGAIETRTQKASDALKNALVDLGIPRDNLTKMLNLDFPKNDLPFRLLVVQAKIDRQVVTPTLHFVFAYKIDLCSGAGRIRIRTRIQDKIKDSAMPSPIKEARTPPWLEPGRWTDTIKNRVVVEGMDGLTEATPAVARVCVVGSGGVGLNQMERAIFDGTTCLDWVASNFMVDNMTFALKRNDTVLKTRDPVVDADVDEAFMPPGGANDTRKPPRERAEPEVKADLAKNIAFKAAKEAVYNPGEGPNFELTPGSKSMRLGQHATLDVPSVAAQGGKVVVEFRQTANKAALMTDFFKRNVNLTGGANGFFPFSDLFAPSHDDCCGQGEYQNGNRYDRLVLCLGQDQNLTGEPITIADAFEFTPIVYQNRAVGLQNNAGAGANEGVIRILGSAATMFPAAKISPPAGGDPYKRMEEYRKTLPASAVLPGFIMNCCNIAAANGFFANGKDNDNANTASQSDLEKLLGKGGLAPTDRIASLIIKCRSAPEDGFSDMDKMISRLNVANPTAAQDWGADWQDKIRGVLDTCYREPDKWQDPDTS